MQETLAILTEKKNSPIVMGKEIKGKITPMSLITSESGKVNVEGEIFKIEEKEVRTGVILLVYVSDENSAVMLKRFFTKPEEAASFKEKLAVRCALHP